MKLRSLIGAVVYRSFVVLCSFGISDLFRISDFAALVALPGFLIFLIIRRNVEILGRNPIALLGPSTEIDEPAAVGTKWPVRIVFPGGFLATSGTFYFLRHGFCPLYVECVGSEKFLHS
jgi:hypothetical protein